MWLLLSEILCQYGVHLDDLRVIERAGGEVHLVQGPSCYSAT